MPNVYRKLKSAFSLLTIIPIRAELVAGSSAYFGFVGLFLGAAEGAAFYALNRFSKIYIAVLVVMSLDLLLTGAIHYDGFADSADAFFSGKDRNSRLEILKDPRVGTMGATTLIVVFLARYVSLSIFPKGFFLAVYLMGLLALTRGSINAFYLFGEPITRGLSSQIQSHVSTYIGLFCGAVIFCLATLGLYWESTRGIYVCLISLLAVVVSFLVSHYLSKSRLGGFNGDTFGYFIVLAESLSLLSASSLVSK